MEDESNGSVVGEERSGDLEDGSYGLCGFEVTIGDGKEEGGGDGGGGGGTSGVEGDTVASVDEEEAGTVVEARETGPPAKKRRKRYSDDDKERIVRAYRQGGMNAVRTVADVLRVNQATARKWACEYNKGNTGVLHDRRHDQSVHVGRNSKLQDWMGEFLLHELHMDSCLSQETLLVLLNTESLRRILEKHGIAIPDDYHGHNTTDYSLLKSVVDQQPPDVQQEFENVRIKATSTVGHYLNGMFITRKHVVKEKITMNNPQTMAQRKTWAEALRRVLQNEKNFLVFMDSMPFYVNMSRSHGYAPRGERAVTKSLPQSNLSYRTQVAMGVNPAEGLLCGDIFPPKKVGSARKTSWGKDEAFNFLDQLFGTLCEKESLIRGKTVFIIQDNASEHGSKDDVEKVIAKLPNAIKLSGILKDSNGSLRMSRAPPNSPQLNLCEYYNRALRSKANRLRHLPEYSSILLQAYPRGQVIDQRLGVLETIIRKSLTDISEGPPLSSAVSKLHSFLAQVINSGGYLDMRQPM